MKPKEKLRAREGTQYVEEIVLQLAKIARDDGSDDLAMILEMAALEAKNCRETVRERLP